MEQYQKSDGHNYYLKQLNKDGGYSWVKINLQSSTEPVEELAKNEIVLNIPQHDYYFTQDNEINEEKPEGIQWENVGNFEQYTK
jgi:ABC-type metal ion transport system substrate-binding protein